MDGKKSDAWLVRSGDSTRTVASLDALIALRQSGALDAATMVQAPGSTRWQRLGDVGLAAPADPWAAWDDSEAQASVRAAPLPPAPALASRIGEDPRRDASRFNSPGAPRPVAGVEVDVTVELSDDPVTEPPDPAPRPRVAPVIQPPAPATRVASVAPKVDAPPVAPIPPPTFLPGPPTPAVVGGERLLDANTGLATQGPPRGPPDNIIAFPAGRRPQLHGQLALDEDPLPAIPMGIIAAQPPPTKVAAPGRTLRWQAIAIYSAVSAVCLLGLGLARWYVRESAQATYSLEPGGVGSAGRPVASAPAATAPAASAPPSTTAPAASAPVPIDPSIGAVYASLEDELRALMLVEIMTIDAQGELEDALFIELRRVRVDLVSVDAEVTAWGGRQLDLPQAARFDVRLRANPDNVDRELAAVALVIGKYIHQYSLEVATFDVVIEGVADTPLLRPIDPVAARELYLQRRSLAAFIDGMRQ
jgi:hypothetical protein